MRAQSVAKQPLLSKQATVNRDEREEMRRLFKGFSDVASKFSHEVAPSPSAAPAISSNAELNLQVTKTVFGKWSLEILVMLYTMKSLGFEQMRKSLNGISHRVLSEKLKQLEARRLIRRQVLTPRPVRVKYSLTEKGLIVARLGEPVFLFLRYEEGFESLMDENTKVP